MESIYLRLEEIREAPEVYLGEKSLFRLASYIYGYLDSEYNYDEAYVSSFGKFNDYVKQVFNIQSDHDWVKIILFYSSTEVDAVDLFYKLLDKFLLQVET